jgi:hypothetical protein
MSLSDWKKRIGMTGVKSAGQFVAPTFALDLEPSFVAAARLRPSKRQVQSVGVRQLPPGTLVPSANKSNITDSAALQRTISEVSARVGNTGSKPGLLIPDVSVRVALLQFENLPANRQEADTLVLWRMREFLPYAPEEARLSYQVISTQPDAVDLLGIAVRTSVLAEYESVMERLNGGPVLVLPATVALLPLLPEESAGQLLLHLCPGSLTSVVVSFNRVRYWRTRALEGEAVKNLEEVAREATRVLATCQDNLQVQVETVWFCSRPPAEQAVEDALAHALGRELRPLSANLLPGGALPAGDQEAFNEVGLPFAGLVANSGNRK